MFFYTHVVDQNYGYRITSTSTASTYEDEPGAINSETASGLTLIQTDAGQIISSTEGQNGATQPSFSYNGTSFVFAGNVATDVPQVVGDYRTTYSYGTAPRSRTAQTATETTEATILNTAGSQVPFTDSATFTFGPVGYSTGVDSVTFFTSPTATAALTQTYWTIGTGTATTVLSATAPATITVTGIGAATLSAVTTLVPIFAISMQTVQRWYKARQHPPPLRRAGIAFAATHGASSAAVASLSAGLNRFLDDLSIATSSSSTETAGANQTIQSTDTYWTGARVSHSTSKALAVITAQRSLVSGLYSAGSFFSAISYTPTVVGSWSSGVSVASQLRALSVFTQPLFSDSTTYRWSFVSFSWKLYGTTRNSSTSSTFEVGINSIGAASAALVSANAIIGATTAVLGPVQPFTASGLNIVSVTTQNTGGGSVFYSGRNSSSGSSFSASANASASLAATLGSAIGSEPVTFADSLLSYAVAHVAASVSTSTFSSFAPVNPADIPSLYSAEKWNEAGQGDAVSVNQ